MRLTSVMEAPMRRGKQAATTNVSFQLNVKAITKAVRVRATFCTMVESLLARALLTNVASTANIAVNEPVLFSSRSNHATSLVRIAASQINYNDLVM
jgi:hypothetical protein